MVKESLQAGETAVRLAASGIKNVAALLIALAQSDRQIIGKTSIKKLTKDPSPAMVLPLKATASCTLSPVPRGKRAQMLTSSPMSGTPPSSTPYFRPWATRCPSSRRSRIRNPRRVTQKKPPPALNKGDPRPSAGMARKRRRGHLTPPSRRASPLSGAAWQRCKRPPRAWKNPHPCGRKSAHAENHYIIL